MTNKVINFSDLGRTEVRCIIYKGEDGVVKAEYSNKEIKRLQEQIENPIVVYNATPETQIKLQAIVSKAGQGVNVDKKDLVITAKELILEYLPLCTNIILDLDAILDKDKIESIVNDPSKEFEIIIKEVSKIVFESSQTYSDNIDAFTRLSKEEKERILKEIQPKVEEESEEEKELREAEESLLAIKERIQNKSNKSEVIEINKIKE